MTEERRDDMQAALHPLRTREEVHKTLVDENHEVLGNATIALEHANSLIEKALQDLRKFGDVPFRDLDRRR